MPKSNIEHFAKCAGNGGHPSASHGERVANRLAMALAEIGDSLCLLDSLALEGAIALMRAMVGPWKTDAEKRAVYKLLAEVVNRQGKE